jgi:hypothetical protein
MRSLWLGCLVVFVLAVRTVVAADAIEIAEPESDARIRSVRSHVQVVGEQMTPGGGGKVIPLKLNLDAQYRFLERRLSGAGRDAETLRSVRLYRFANSEIEVTPADAPAGAPPKKSTLKLPETKHLIVAQGRREGPFLYSTTATLTFDQLDLIRTPGDSLALLGLLPREAVNVGETWKPESWAVQMMSGLEAMLKGEITCKLEEATETIARITFTGSAEGATVGATSGIQLVGELTFDRQQKLISKARVKQTEKRSVGAVSPGIEVTASVVLERSLAEETNDAKLLNDAAVAEIPIEPAPEMQFLRFESWGLRFYHDRNWHQFHQTKETAILRLMEQGSLVAQVNVSPVPAAIAGSHTPEERFLADIKQSLGKKLKSITKSEQFPPRNAADRRFLFRAIIDGEVDGVPMTWHYYLCAAPTGQQVAFVFAIETKQLEKFGNRDQTIVRLLEFIPTRQAQK